jgi:hypothetical protein
VKSSGCKVVTIPHRREIADEPFVTSSSVRLLRIPASSTSGADGDEIIGDGEAPQLNCPDDITSRLPSDDRPTGRGTGNVKNTVAPIPTAASAHTRPPWRSMTR